MLVGFPTRHINLDYMQHKMWRADSLLQEMQCRKGNVATHSVRMPGVGNGKAGALGFARMDPEQIEEARLSALRALE